jgi:hypothetical protein
MELEQKSLVRERDKEEKCASYLFRSPTLDTVDMIEETARKHSGELKRTQLWKKLPKKVMWSTFLRALSYLEKNNKIVLSRGIVVYIWNPTLASKYIKKRGIKYHGRKKSNR